jgi:hypothetical protein
MSLRLPIGMPALLLAILALISQLALGSLVLPDSVSAREQSVAALDALSILCSTGTPAAPGNTPAHHHHAPDCTLCPLCVTLAAPSAILTTVAALPAPSSQAVARAALPPPARGPPSQARPVPPARGPPILT